jgi:hypothetical protein
VARVFIDEEVEERHWLTAAATKLAIKVSGFGWRLGLRRAVNLEASICCINPFNQVTCSL